MIVNLKANTANNVQSLFGEYTGRTRVSEVPESLRISMKGMSNLLDFYPIGGRALVWCRF